MKFVSLNLSIYFSNSQHQHNRLQPNIKPTFVYVKIMINLHCPSNRSLVHVYQIFENRDKKTMCVCVLKIII